MHINCSDSPLSEVKGQLLRRLKKLPNLAHYFFMAGIADKPHGVFAGKHITLMIKVGDNPARGVRLPGGLGGIPLFYRKPILGEP